jgi:putative molybdopterin biosynthesis protein
MDATFLTGKEIAEILKISKALAYRLIAKGQIASVRFGRTVRVKREDLEQFIRQNSSELVGVKTDINSKQGVNHESHAH